MKLELKKNLKWLGRPVLEGKGHIGELRQEIPRFTMAPFSVEGRGVNKYLNLIVREPSKENQGYLLPSDDQDEFQIPLATVSKQYKLVQHRHIVKALEDAFRHVGFNPDCLQAKLTITEYGERMWISFTLPKDSQYVFDLNKRKHVLQVNALNSVDKTTALEINLTWYSLNSMTGMMVRRDARLKKIHLKSRKPEGIEEFLKKQLGHALNDINRVKRWHQTKVIFEEKELSKVKPSAGQIEHWIDTTVAKKWSDHIATRVYHIAKTGYDGEITSPPEPDVPPHKCVVRPKSLVPGAFAPVRNAYDISQVLSWIANDRKTIQDRLEWMMDIPFLMHALLRQKRPLTLSM